MHWDEVKWSEVDHRAVQAQAYRVLEHAYYQHVTKDGVELRPWAPTRNKAADLLEAIAAITHLPAAVHPPRWIDGAGGSRQAVACANGLLDIATRRLTEHVPSYFNLVSVPFCYEPSAPDPIRWIRFLQSLWAHDPEAIHTLQEFFGYVISARTDLDKILLLVGPTRAGKGAIARVLGRLVGPDNVAGPTLASLGQNFGLQDLTTKTLAVISDARLGQADTHQVVERLLAISGRDTLTVDRKYRDPWTGQLPTRFVIISNELPRFGDASGAIAHRFVVLNLTKSWLGREDRDLEPGLMAELPGILNWALDGLDRLSARDRFTEPSSSVDAVNALADLVSPVAAFVRDSCTRGANGEVLCDELYAAWRRWALDNGHPSGSIQTFGRDLRAVVPGLRIRRTREADQRSRHDRGLELAADPQTAGPRAIADQGSPGDGQHWSAVRELVGVTRVGHSRARTLSPTPYWPACGTPARY